MSAIHRCPLKDLSHLHTFSCSDSRGDTERAIIGGRLKTDGEPSPGEGGGQASGEWRGFGLGEKVLPKKRIGAALSFLI